MKLKHGTTVHDLVRRPEDRFDVDGVPVQAAVVSSGPSRFEGRTQAGRTALFVVRDGDRVFAQVGGRNYRLQVVHRPAVGTDPADSGALEAPMPGRVTRVTVAVGDAVKRGQELIVVEAMKMENALLAPADGIVKSLAAQVGDMVAPGPALVVIEAAP